MDNGTGREKGGRRKGGEKRVKEGASKEYRDAEEGNGEGAIERQSTYK